MILEKFPFSFAFDLSKQNKTDFSFISLILYKMGFFGAAHGWGGGQKAPLPSCLKSVAHILQLRNLVQLYLT